MSSGGAELTITRDGPEVAAALILPGRTPAAALGGFTEPELLRKWWPGDLTADLRPGGVYRVHFGSLGQTMNGVVETYAAGERLSFSWGWAHELDLAGRFLVTVTVSPHARAHGALLALRHGPRPGTALTPREGEIEGHRQGWEYFLPRLAETV
jgi:uncharacterized protein YndB with AHSA1/START domain